MLEIIQLAVLQDNYIYLLHEAEQNITAVIDPAESEPVLKTLQDNSWSLDYILNTHHHNDHVGANLQLKSATHCKVIGAQQDQHRIPGIDIPVAHGQHLELGNEGFEVIETPGHTLGHICFYFPDSSALFCGDTLFSMGCGRLFEGTAEQMWNSLQLIKALPESTRIYCAHEYTQANGKFSASLEADNPALQRRLIEVEHLRQNNRPTIPTTLSQELSTNPFLREQCLPIQQAVNKEGASDVEVFAEIRRLKDIF